MSAEPHSVSCRLPSRHPAGGFTLIELMVAVAIIGILLALAVPSYVDYLRRGSMEEGAAALATARIDIEQYFLDNRTYVGFGCPAATPHFSYACVTAASSYTITATGRANVAGFVLTVNESNARSSSGPWGTGACWILRKGDSC